MKRLSHEIENKVKEQVEEATEISKHRLFQMLKKFLQMFGLMEATNGTINISRECFASHCTSNEKRS